MAARKETAKAREILVQPTQVEPPPSQLSKDAFSKRIPLRALQINPRFCKIFMDAFRNTTLNIARFRNIVEDPENKGGKDTTKLLLLCPSISSLQDMTEPQRALIKEHNAKLVNHEIELGFSYWSADQIIRAAIPESLKEITTAFETIGHIAHMNLRDSQLPYKTLIGQVILAKNNGLKTVVNKLKNIDAKFRFFKMEVLAGEPNFETMVKESGCIFKMKYDEVYWNSRLHHEHDRIIKKLKKGDIVYDMFAGIGPFALPAAKCGCRVFANDLNPKSYEALVANIKVNKVENLVDGFNMDGREFIRHMASKWDDGKLAPPNCDHILMNLPASAHEFLDVFRGLYSNHTGLKMPIIHCYCFSSAEDLQADAIKMCEDVLQGTLKNNVLEVHEVRDVAPKKRMMCVSFQLPKSIAFNENTSEPDPKKQRLD